MFRVSRSVAELGRDLKGPDMSPGKLLPYPNHCQVYAKRRQGRREEKKESQSSQLLPSTEYVNLLLDFFFEARLQSASRGSRYGPIHKSTTHKQSHPGASSSILLATKSTAMYYYVFSYISRQSGSKPDPIQVSNQILPVRVVLYSRRRICMSQLGHPTRVVVLHR